MIERQGRSDPGAQRRPELERKKRSPALRIASGISGASLGLFCLWLVLRGVDSQDLADAIGSARFGYLLLALAAYWAATGIRIARWHQLLLILEPVRLRQVAESAVIGYAAGIAMPARLGEPFRAEYTQRRFGIDRFAVFGSIVTERLIDVVAVVVILIAGLALAAREILARDMSSLGAIVIAAVLVVIAATAGLATLDLVQRKGMRLPVWLNRMLYRLLYGVATLNRRNLGLVSGLTLLIWAFEVGALWSIFRALDSHPSLPQVFVLTGVATLSTLVPAAPGYLGTLQLALGFGMTALGLSAAVGVLAATLLQIQFYGSLIIVATLIYVFRGSSGGEKTP